MRHRVIHGKRKVILFGIGIFIFCSLCSRQPVLALLLIPVPESYDPISAPLPDYPEDRSFFLTPPNYDDTEFENFIFVPPDGTTQDNMNPADEDTIYIHPDGSGTYIIVE